MMGADTIVVPPEMDEIPNSVWRAWWAAVRLLTNLALRPFVWTLQCLIPGSKTMVAIFFDPASGWPHLTSKLLALIVGDVRYPSFVMHICTSQGDSMSAKICLCFAPEWMSRMGDGSTEIDAFLTLIW